MTKPHQVNESVPTYGASAEMNADLKGAHMAIRRAAQRARQIARQTGTDLIVARAGKVVRLPQSKGKQE